MIILIITHKRTLISEADEFLKLENGRISINTANTFLNIGFE